MTEPSTRDKLLDLAAELCQTRGFNAFSYRDLAGALGIKTSTIHYYFPAKVDLGRELMRQYRERFKSAVERIDAESTSATEKLDRYADSFLATFRNGGRICMCASLASDLTTLPEEVSAEVRAYFAENEAWLADVLREGQEAGTLSFEGDPLTAARTLFSALEGSMLAARAHSSQDRLAEMKRWLLAGLFTAPV